MPWKGQACILFVHVCEQALIYDTVQKNTKSQLSYTSILNRVEMCFSQAWASSKATCQQVVWLLSGTPRKKIHIDNIRTLPTLGLDSSVGRVLAHSSTGPGSSPTPIIFSLFNSSKIRSYPSFYKFS